MKTKILRTKIKGSGLFAIDVVGESHYQENLGQIVKSNTASIHYGGRSSSLSTTFQIEARVVSEPNNAHDSNAIQVLIRDLKVGYLDRNTASRLTAQVMRRGFDQIDSTCTSLVSGVCGANGDFLCGVKLDIDSESQRRLSDEHSNESEFTFLVADPTEMDNSIIGMSVKFWQHPSNPAQIRIYCGDPIGRVPDDFVIPIRRHLIAELQFETKVEAKTDNTWQIKCRLIPESETSAIAEKNLQERKDRLELSLVKPYRPVKPISFRFETGKDNLKKGDLLEVVELPNIDLIVKEYGRLPVGCRCIRTGKLFETMCEHELVEKLVRLSIETKSIVAKVTLRFPSKNETTWFDGEVPPPVKPASKKSRED